MQKEIFVPMRLTAELQGANEKKKKKSLTFRKSQIPPAPGMRIPYVKKISVNYLGLGITWVG